MLKTIARKLDPEQDAIDLLKGDHRKVEALFKEFGSADDGRTKVRLAREICAALDVHAKIEEKIFYPESKAEAKDAADAVNEGFVEHEGIKRLVKQIPEMNASDEFFDSRMKVLEEYVKHHVREEESSMFPKIVESGIDLKALGARMAAAKKRYAVALPARSNGRSKAASGSTATRSA